MKLPSREENAGASGEGFDFDGEYGRVYEDLVKQVMPCYEQISWITLAFLDRCVGAESRILIAGAGTGTETITIASARPAWRIVAVEPSAQMMTVLKERVLRHSSELHVALVQGTVCDLPQNELYDGATAILVMHLLPDDGTKLVFLRSIIQRLKRNARFILIDGQRELSDDHTQRFLTAWQTYCRERGTPQSTLDRHSNAITSGESPFISESRTIELLQQAGFGRIDKCFSVFHWNGYVCEKTE